MTALSLGLGLLVVVGIPFVGAVLISRHKSHVRQESFPLDKEIFRRNK